MTDTELISIIGPILVSLLVSLTPLFVGNFLENQSGILAEDLRKGRVSKKSAEEIKQYCVGLGNGASLPATFLSSSITYVYGWSQLIGIHYIGDWYLFWVIAWALFVLSYFLYALLQTKLYLLPLTFVPNPARRIIGPATLPITHFSMLSLLFSISSFVLIVFAVFATVLQPEAANSSVPAG